MRMVAVLLLLLCTAHIVASDGLVPVDGDLVEVVLKNGSTRQGFIRSHPASERIDLEINHGRISGLIHLDRRQIESIAVVQNDDQQRLAQLTSALQLADQDPEKLWDLSQQLKPLDRVASEAALRQIIALQPDHQLAHQALGHRLHQGVWLSEGDYQRALGRVFFEGQWISQEQYETHLALAAQQQADREARAEARRQAAAERRQQRQAAQRASQSSGYNQVAPVAVIAPPWRWSHSQVCRQQSSGVRAVVQFGHGGFRGTLTLGR